MNNIHAETMVNLACLQCGKTFKRSLSNYVAKKKRNPSGHVFCSDACARLFRWGGHRTEKLICNQCGKEIERYRCETKPRGKNQQGHFCSPACLGKWRSTHLVGENSPEWEGGYYMEYGGSHWKRQRRLARERDHHTCQDCGAIEQAHGYKMDVHHLVAYDLFDDPEQANDLSNLTTLCRVCHVKRHRLMSDYMDTRQRSADWGSCEVVEFQEVAGVGSS